MLKLETESLSFIPEDYNFWTRFYYEKFGWITTPRTCKSGMALTEPVVQDDQWFDYEACETLSYEYLEQSDWLERGCEIAAANPKTLNGIALVLDKSDLVLVDFDDVRFFWNWTKIFRIRSKTAKSFKGYHLYLKPSEPFKNTLSSNVYGVSGIEFAMLPPSLYMKKDGQYRHKKTKLRYMWHDLELEIPTVDLYQNGLLPPYARDLPYNYRYYCSEHNLDGRGSESPVAGHQSAKLTLRGSNPPTASSWSNKNYGG